jgi:hypothetical protein
LTPRRPAVPLREIERRPILVIVHLDHAAELLEVGPGCGALNPQQAIERMRAGRRNGEALQHVQRARRGLDVVALEQRPLVANLRRDQIASDEDAEALVVGATELLAPQEHVFEGGPTRHGVQPAARREMRDWLVVAAERLDRASRHLDAAEHVDLRHVHQPCLLNHAGLVAYLQDFVSNADNQPESRHIQRPLIVSRRDEASDFLSIRSRVNGGLDLEIEWKQLRPRFVAVRRQLRVERHARFVGQADRDKRAARAFRAVDERWGNAPRLRDRARRGQCRFGFGDEVSSTAMRTRCFVAP